MALPEKAAVQVVSRLASRTTQRSDIDVNCDVTLH
jgi:hypothetical protein